MQIPHDLALFAAQSFFLMANLDEELFQSDLRAYQNFAIVWAYYAAWFMLKSRLQVLSRQQLQKTEQRQ